MSRLDSLAAIDFPRAFPEATETVIRRMGGQADRTEDVEAVVEFVEQAGGLTTDGKGQMIEFGGILEVAAAQETTGHDHWVIRGEVYHQIGEATGKDGGSQTIYLTRRKGRIAKEPRVR